MNQGGIFTQAILNHACQDFGWWTKLRLAFVPLSYSKDSGVTVYFKTLGGRIYVTRITYAAEPPQKDTKETK